MKKPSEAKCICCKTNNVRTTRFCENCFNFLIPKKDKGGLGWNDIWVIICNWYAIHDETDKDYEFVHDVILVAYSEKYFGRVD